MPDTEQQLLESQVQIQTEASRKELEVAELERMYALDSLEEQEQEEQDIEYANQLALERDQQNNITASLAEEGASFSSPSLIKYYILLFWLAIPNDVIDSFEFSGFGVIVAWSVSLFLSMASILISWMTDQEQKRAQGYMKIVKEFEKNATQTIRTAARATKLFRKTKFITKANKNPTIKLLIGGAAELIPILSILPWSSICTILAYLDERKTYKNARKSGEDISTQISNPEPEMV